MNQDQIGSLVRSALKIIGTALTAHGLSSAANTINSEDVIGAVTVLVGIVWSHYNHTTPVNPPKTP